MPILISILFTAAAWALEFEKRADVQINGGDRWVHAFGLAPQNAYQDGVLVAGADLSFSWKSLVFSVRPELRALWSESAAAEPGSPENLPLVGPTRFADLTARLIDTDRQRAYLDWQRLDLDYRDGQIDATVGRRLFSAGVMRLFPIWNKFSRPLPFLPSPIILYGQDQATFNVQHNAWTGRAAWLLERDSPNNTAWAELGWLPAGFELHALAAHWWGRRAFGLAGAADLGGATLRAEALSLDDHAQVGFGAERGFGTKWTGLVEVFYQDEGVTHRGDYRVDPPSRFTPLRARAYSGYQATYQARETLTLITFALVNHVDGSVYGGLKLDDSITANANVILEFKGPFGRRGDEFSTAALNFPDGSSLGAPSQISVSYKHYF